MWGCTYVGVYFYVLCLPTAQVKPKRKTGCDWSFWVPFMLLVLAFVVGFFAWDYYWTEDGSYITRLISLLRERLEW